MKNRHKLSFWKTLYCLFIKSELYYYIRAIISTRYNLPTKEMIKKANNHGILTHEWVLKMFNKVNKEDHSSLFRKSQILYYKELKKLGVGWVVVDYSKTKNAYYEYYKDFVPINMMSLKQGDVLVIHNSSYPYKGKKDYEYHICYHSGETGTVFIVESFNESGDIDGKTFDGQYISATNLNARYANKEEIKRAKEFGFTSLNTNLLSDLTFRLSRHEIPSIDKLIKCQFINTEDNFLGVIIGDERIHGDRKVLSLLNTHKNASQVKLNETWLVSIEDIAPYGRVVLPHIRLS